jgi:aminoglycoside phosphotransferase (APT) family kinase protein
VNEDAAEYLPASLRGPATVLTPVAGGLSGAAVYRVEADGQTFVLKIASGDQSAETWRQQRAMQQRAADAGLSPRVIHVDAARCASVTAFVRGRPFVALYTDPVHKARAVQELGDLLRRLHRLALPPGSPDEPQIDRLIAIRDALAAAGGIPGFVHDAIERTLDAGFPRDRPMVLSHNDVNPGNIVQDGERLLLVDWDASGPNHPLFDLASIAAFLRMDDRTCGDLLSAYEGEAVYAPPPSFIAMRRFVAILCGATGLALARRNGHAGASGDDTLASVPGLGEFYQRMRSGAVSIGQPEGQWSFGLALVKEGML